MALGDMPLLGVLKTKLRWHQARQAVLSENVANADTPGFRAKDLVAPEFDPDGTLSARTVRVASTNPRHIQPSPVPGVGDPEKSKTFETTPEGNNVVLEDEMMKVAQNSMDHQMVSQMYNKSLGMIRLAIGKK